MKKILLDCDNCMGSFFWEVDDGLVILYLLNQPEAELLGITTTFGNKSYCHTWTEILLKETGRTDIPLYKGAQGPGAPVTEAAHFLAQTAATHPGEITLLAAGPLGNLAAAAAVDPAFFDNLKEIIVMGGVLEPLVLGRRPVPELNLSADADATMVVLASRCPVVVMNSHICLEAPFYWKDLWRLTTFPRRYKKYLRRWLFTHLIGTGLRNFYLWDLLLPSYAFHPEFFETAEAGILSTREDMETGFLRLSEDGSGRRVVMPRHILDRKAFMDDLVARWNALGRRLQV